MMQTTLTLIMICLFTTSWAQNADIELLRNIHLERNTKLDKTYLYITHSASPMSIAAPAAVFAIGLLAKNMDLRKKGVFLGEVLVISTVFTFGMKYGIKRDRPFVTHPEIQKLTSAASPSFPSGHTSAAFATATSMTLAFPKWYVAVPAYLWAGSVGYSRMHLGVHYPSDVLMGALLGSGAAILTYYMNRWMNSKMYNPMFFPSN